MGETLSLRRSGSSIRQIRRRRRRVVALGRRRLRRRQQRRAPNTTAGGGPTRRPAGRRHQRRRHAATDHDGRRRRSRAARSPSASRPRSATRGRRPTCNCDSACQTRARTFFEPLDGGRRRPTSRSSRTWPRASRPSADYKMWTIKLRPGITFTDGTPLNADVVIDNLNRACKSPLLGPIFTDVTDVAKVDDMTLTVTDREDAVGRPLLVLRQLDRLHGVVEVAGRGRRRPDQGHPARRHRTVHPRRRSRPGESTDRQEEPELLAQGRGPALPRRDRLPGHRRRADGGQRPQVRRDRRDRHRRTARTSRTSRTTRAYNYHAAGQVRRDASTS